MKVAFSSARWTRQNRSCHRLRLAGFSRTDAIAVVGTCTLVLAVVGAMIAKHKSEHSRMSCFSNLQGLSSAYASFAFEANASPSEVSTNLGGSAEFIDDPRSCYRHFAAFCSNSRPLSLLVCPADNRKPAANYRTLSNFNISYFLAINKHPLFDLQPILGDRNIVPNQQTTVVCSTLGNITWDRSIGLHGDYGYIAYADSHVEATTNRHAQSVISAKYTSRLILAVP